MSGVDVMGVAGGGVSVVGCCCWFPERAEASPVKNKPGTYRMWVEVGWGGVDAMSGIEVGGRWVGGVHRGCGGARKYTGQVTLTVVFFVMNAAFLLVSLFSGFAREVSRHAGGGH